MYQTQGDHANHYTLRAPNAIPNNELLDFLSRVPSDSELVGYRQDLYYHS
jgi:hypothetical protein